MKNNLLLLIFTLLFISCEDEDEGEVYNRWIVLKFSTQLSFFYFNNYNELFSKAYL